jgi:hypothetical protein
LTILGWSASFFARARYRMLPLAALYLACALSYTRAQAPAHAEPREAAQPAKTFALPSAGAAAGYEINDAQELIRALRLNRVDAQAAAKLVIERADPAMIDGLLRYASNGSRRERAQRVIARMGRKAVPILLERLGDEAVAVTAGGALYQVLGPADHERIPALIDCVERRRSLRFPRRKRPRKRRLWPRASRRAANWGGPTAPRRSDGSDPAPRRPLRRCERR